MRFEFATAHRTLFGPGVVGGVAPLAASHGHRSLGVVGKTAGRVAPLLAQLKAQGIETTTFQVAVEPTVETVLAGLQQARAAACELIIGLGGG